ncbi:MAG: MBL fold metallo-hydrolase [Ruminococcaceae bacterium]|nr:MBL fold metallo-hydrolase [Oscillospiraceae bacterium]
MKAFHIVASAPYYTNTFLLISDGGHGVVIDPAADAEVYLKQLEEDGATLTHILLTHGHFDHVGAVDALKEKTGAKLYMNAADAKMFEMQPDETYTDGGTIQVDELSFTVIFTPGHTPGSVCIRCGDLLFTGDTLFAGDIGRTDFPGSSTTQMRESLRKLRDTITDNPQVLPGHEEFSTMDNEKQHNPYLRG